MPGVRRAWLKILAGELMSVAIIAGSGIYDMPSLDLRPERILTGYGEAWVKRGPLAQDEIIFLARHGPRHELPPHRVNYRANLQALLVLGVERIVAINAVGSINPDIPPLSVAILSDFLDFTTGREPSFFEGGEQGVVHVDMSEPYCPSLRTQILSLAPAYDLSFIPRATYVCTNGPRFETAAEIRMFARLGGDVVGMTGVPEVSLARELGMHYSALAFSVNWAVGVQPQLQIVKTDRVKEVKDQLIALALEVLQLQWQATCKCDLTAGQLTPKDV